MGRLGPLGHAGDSGVKLQPFKSFNLKSEFGFNSYRFTGLAWFGLSWFSATGTTVTSRVPTGGISNTLLRITLPPKWKSFSQIYQDVPC